MLRYYVLCLVSAAGVLAGCSSGSTDVSKEVNQAYHEHKAGGPPPANVHPGGPPPGVLNGPPGAKR